MLPSTIRKYGISVTDIFDLQCYAVAILGANCFQTGRQISLDQARAELLKPVAARRFGRPEELADACAFLCSTQAGYISGQNLQVDGGSYEGLI